MDMYVTYMKYILLTLEPCRGWGTDPHAVENSNVVISASKAKKLISIS